MTEPQQRASQDIDRLLASPATRALTSAEHLAKALGIKGKDIVVDDRLYAAAANELLAVIHALGDEPQRVMLVAHNPGLTDLAHCFAGDITHMPTCAVAELTFAAASWGDIGEDRATRVVFGFPKKAQGRVLAGEGQAKRDLGE